LLNFGEHVAVESLAAKYHIACDDENHESDS
jgi:hypothetical protein